MRIFPSSLQVSSVEEAQKRLQSNDIPAKRRTRIAAHRTLIDSGAARQGGLD